MLLVFGISGLAHTLLVRWPLDALAAAVGRADQAVALLAALIGGAVAQHRQLIISA